MYRNMPDISMFRFHSWEPVWYYKPAAKYPAANFLQGRFVEITLDYGVSFTYKIWTTPNDIWEDGCELIRKIVRSRSKEQDEPWAEYKKEDLELTRTKLTQGQKNKEK
jgi:hypoxanthine phosphoribosyltransferase